MSVPSPTPLELPMDYIEGSYDEPFYMETVKVSGLISEINIYTDITKSILKEKHLITRNNVFISIINSYYYNTNGDFERQIKTTISRTGGIVTSVEKIDI